MIQAKAKLEADWRSFEAEVKKYVESFGEQIGHQQTVFKRQADAQWMAESVAKVPKRRAAKFPLNDKTGDNRRSM